MRRSPLPLLLSVALMVLTIVAFGHVCSSEYHFLNIDDEEYVTGNRHVVEGMSVRNLWWALTAFHSYNWHPLTWISLQLDFELNGLDVAGYHGTNVMLHVANVVLLFHTLRRMTAAVWRSAAVAAFFAVHPFRVESVVWISERKDVLCALFWMLTMLAYLRYAEKPGVWRYLVMVLMFALGLLAKPMLVTLPCALLLFDYWPLCRLHFSPRATPESFGGPDTLVRPFSTHGPDKSVRPTALVGTSDTLVRPFSTRWPDNSIRPAVSVGRALLEKAPLLALALGCSYLTVLAQQEIVKPLEQLTVGNRISNALNAYFVYIKMMLWPSELTVYYPHRRHHLGDVQVGWAVLFVSGVTVFAVREVRRRPYLFVGWFWYLGTLVPVIGLVQVGTQAFADRYTYIPLIGMFIMLAWGAAEVVQRRHIPKVFPAAVALSLLCACVLRTWSQTAYWKSSVALWSHTLEVTQFNPEARLHLADAFFGDGKIADARAQLLTILLSNPDDTIAHFKMAQIATGQGKLEEAVYHYGEVLRRKPNLAEAYDKLGQIFLRLAHRDFAIHIGQVHLRLARGDSATQFVAIPCGLAAASLAREERLRMSIDYCQQAVNRNPGEARYHYHLGAALNLAGQTQAAKAEFDEGSRLEQAAR